MYLGWIPPDEIDAEHFAGPREGYGPPVVAIAELFGRDVAMEVTRDRASHNEREHVRVGPIRKADEAR